jgi:putative transposase
MMKRERIRRHKYSTRNDARQDLYEYIGMFYNPKRKRMDNGMLSPCDLEERQLNLNKAGV